MADPLLLVLYLIGLCTGAIVAMYGLAMLVDGRLGGRAMGAAGHCCNLGTHFPLVKETQKALEATSLSDPERTRRLVLTGIDGTQDHVVLQPVKFTYIFGPPIT